jgi:hypothetical protein
MYNEDQTRFHVALGVGGAFLLGALILLIVGLIDGLTGVNHTATPVTIGLIVGGVLTIVYVVLGPILKWGYSSVDDALRDPNADCNSATRSENLNDLPCYCEENFTVALRQPINTLSALAFVLSAALILFIVQDQFPLSAVRNPMENALSMYPILYGIVILFMGPASMFLHASMRGWGGWTDNFSIVLWLVFCLVYSIMSVAVPHDMETTGAIVAFLVIFGLLAAGLGTLTAFVSDARDIVVAAGAFVWGVWEFILIGVQAGGSPIGSVYRDGGLFIAGFIIVMIALVLNILSGGPGIFGKEANMPCASIS